MTLQIRRFLEDNESSELFADLLRFVRATDFEVDPEHPPKTAGRLRSDLIDDPIFSRRLLVALDSNTVLGTSTMFLNHLKANRDKGEVIITVHPQARREGIGRALIQATIAEAKQDERSSLLLINPLSEATKGFWASAGCKLRQVEKESRCHLDAVDANLMASWIGGHGPTVGYQLIRSIGACPEEFLPHLIALRDASIDAPLDDIEWEPDQWSGAQIRQNEALNIRRGFEHRRILIVDPDGNPVGLTEVFIHEDDPAISSQGWTIVLSNHRGKKVGRWLKADMYHWLRADRPDVLVLDTENAESNGPMLDINNDMGFSPFLTWGLWQMEIAGLKTRAM